MTRRRCPMHPSVHARAHADKPAVIVAETGETIDYGAMDAASTHDALRFRANGLKHEEVVAFMLDTTPPFSGIQWGGQRAGMRDARLSCRVRLGMTPEVRRCVVWGC